MKKNIRKIEEKDKKMKKLHKIASNPYAGFCQL